MVAGTDKKTVLQKLGAIQTELKSPKNQEGRFGKSRNVEGILESLKPLLKKYNCSVTLDSQVKEVGGRNYILATATFFDNDQTLESLVVKTTAMAWEGELSRGLDAPQVTGSATSYARKYALGGLFAIDDNKDPDSHMEPAEAPMPPQTQPSATAETTPKPVSATLKQVNMIADMAKERFENKEDFKKFAEEAVGSHDNLSLKQASNLITALFEVDKLPQDEPNNEEEPSDGADQG